MKRILLMSILALLALFIGACDNSNPKSEAPVNKIVEANLTDREEAILTNTAEKSFVFDFNVVGRPYKELSVWVEKYEYGKLVDERVGGLRSGIEEKGTIIFTTSRPMENGQSIFNMSISSSGSTGTVTNFEAVPDVNEMASTWGSNTIEENAIGSEMVLSSICYSNADDGNMHSLSPDFYNDVDSNINEIKDYAIVYLLRAEFIE